MLHIWFEEKRPSRRRIWKSEIVPLKRRILYMFDESQINAGTVEKKPSCEKIK